MAQPDAEILTAAAEICSTKGWVTTRDISAHLAGSRARAHGRKSITRYHISQTLRNNGYRVVASGKNGTTQYRKT